jgi:hypothetical protein
MQMQLEEWVYLWNAYQRRKLGAKGTKSPFPSESVGRGALLCFSYLEAWSEYQCVLSDPLVLFCISLI